MLLPRTKEWREARGLSQSELAAAAGVGEATIPRVERGDSVRPATARKLAAALGVTVSDLLESPPVPLASAPANPPRDVGAEDEEGLAVTPELVALVDRMAEDEEGLALLRGDLEAVRVSLRLAHHDDPESRALEREFARAVERAAYVGLKLAAAREAAKSSSVLKGTEDEPHAFPDPGHALVAEDE